MGDQLVLHEDGTVTLGWGDFRVTLREPDIGEWLSFESENTRANEWARNDDGEVPEGEDEPKPRTVLEAATDGPYLALYARLVRELGVGFTGEVPPLPPWLAVGNVYSRISSWWSSSPLSRRAAAALMPTPSQ